MRIGQRRRGQTSENRTAYEGSEARNRTVYVRVPRAYRTPYVGVAARGSGSRQKGRTVDRTPSEEFGGSQSDSLCRGLPRVPDTIASPKGNAEVVIGGCVRSASCLRRSALAPPPTHTGPRRRRTPGPAADEPPVAVDVLSRPVLLLTPFAISSGWDSRARVVL